MENASDLQPAARAELKARYWRWFRRTFDEDRLDTAPVPAEFRPLTEVAAGA